MTNDAVQAPGSDEPVPDAETYRKLSRALEFALHTNNRSMRQLSDLGLTPAEIIERAVGYLEVDLDPDLIGEIRASRAQHAAYDADEFDALYDLAYECAWETFIHSAMALNDLNTQAGVTYREAIETVKRIAAQSMAQPAKPWMRSSIRWSRQAEELRFLARSPEPFPRQYQQLIYDSLIGAVFTLRALSPDFHQKMITTLEQLDRNEPAAVETIAREAIAREQARQ
jgi:hypothetical protein